MNQPDPANLNEPFGDSEQLPPAEAQPVEPMTGDLLPCPFCGASNQDRYPCEWLDGSGANVIRCAWCHGAAPMSVWNRRAPPPSAPVGVEAAADVLHKLRRLALVIREHGTCAPLALDHIGDDLERALAQQPAPSAPVGVDLASLPKKWRESMESADHFNIKGSYTLRRCAEELEAALAQQPAAVDGRTLEAAREAWQASDEGRMLASDINGPVGGKHLRNRLEVAFCAGYDAAKRRRLE